MLVRKKIVESENMRQVKFMVTMSLGCIRLEQKCA